MPIKIILLFSENVFFQDFQEAGGGILKAHTLHLPVYHHCHQIVLVVVESTHIDQLSIYEETGFN